MSSFSFSNTYYALNGIIEDTVDMLVHNSSYEIGYGSAIILITLGIKSIYGPLTMMTQMNAFKMKLIAPEMENH